jgi:hypothetical protein
MSTFLGIVIAAVSVCTFAAVVWMFIGQPRKTARKIEPSKDDSASADGLG